MLIYLELVPNHSKLFTLDKETIDILKETKNQSQTVREAVKHYYKKDTIIEQAPARTTGKITAVLID